MAARVFSITSLRGGLNNTDPPIALADDQVVEARNVEFVRSMLGERRRGADAITLDSNFTDALEILWLHRHLPDGDERNAQLWVWVRFALTNALLYKDTTWHNVTVPDALDTTSPYLYQIRGASSHGKLFIFYKSSVDRSHVFDPNTSTTSLRRVGMTALSTAPTAVDSGGAGTFGTTRYYRTREVVQVSGTTYLRSEPSSVLTFTPDGVHASALVTKPATVNTDPAATHWELEASLDNANFYRINTKAIGLTTATDSTNGGTGYAVSFPLSEDIGDYTPPASYKFGIADEDRLVYISQHETALETARVDWSPVRTATGVGNDERIPLDPVSALSLDGLTGGGIRDVSRAVAGEIWIGKNEHIYKLTRTGNLAHAYKAQLVTTARGFLRGSVCEVIDPDGNPAVFGCDPAVGPILIGRRGIQRCGQDIFVTWKGTVLDAPLIARALYYPEANQVHLWVAWEADEDDRFDTRLTGSTDLHLVLQVNEMRFTADGWRRGWSIWDGPSATIKSCCLYSDNIDAATNRSIILRPFVGTTSQILRLDTGDDDAGTSYHASTTTKPYAPLSLQTKAEIKTSTLIAKAVDGATLTISAIPDGGISPEKTVDDIDCSPVGDETFVSRFTDDIGIAELTTVQVQFADTDTPGSRWELARLDLTVTQGQGS